MVQLGVQMGVVSLAVGSSDVATLVGYAQQFGSPFQTRFTNRPLQDLVLALNNNTDIYPRRFYGTDVYHDFTGEIVDMKGQLKKVAMGDLSKEDGERDTPLGTMIACLSVPLSQSVIATVLAEAILLFAHGEIDEVCAGSLSLLESRLKKYANAILARDSMCNKKELAKEQITQRLRGEFPDFSWHTIFLPPRSPVEEALYAPFLRHILASKVDNETIYVRSTQLLGLSLLLRSYGWMINVRVEDTDGDAKPVDTNIDGAVTVVFSMQPSSKHPNRTYIESREDKVKNRQRRRFHQSTSCKVNNLCEIASLAVCDKEQHAKDYRRAYDEVQETFRESITLKVSFENELICCSMENILDGTHNISRSCRSFVEAFTSHMPHCMQDVIASSLVAITSTNYDWYALMDKLKAERKVSKLDGVPLIYVAEAASNPKQLWATLGAITSAHDFIARALMNVDNQSTVRIPTSLSYSDPTGEGNVFLEKLFDTGVPLGEVVAFCAARFAGVNPSDKGLVSGVRPESLIGYWNGEQGILATPVYERTAYWDLPKEKARPLTLHNVPIAGMPLDDGGWIKPGYLNLLNRRFLPTAGFKPDRRLGPCNVIIEYRPHFEVDTSSVVGAVYLNGVFHSLCSLASTMPCSMNKISTCDHTERLPKPASGYWVADLGSLEPGFTPVLRNDVPGARKHEQQLLVLQPQCDYVARFFSSIAVRGLPNMVQKGCFDCAVEQAKGAKCNYLVPELALSIPPDDALTKT